MYIEEFRTTTSSNRNFLCAFFLLLTKGASLGYLRKWLELLIYKLSVFPERWNSLHVGVRVTWPLKFTDLTENWNNCTVFLQNSAVARAPTTGVRTLQVTGSNVRANRTFIFWARISYTICTFHQVLILRSASPWWLSIFFIHTQKLIRWLHSTNSDFLIT